MDKLEKRFSAHNGSGDHPIHISRNITQDDLSFFASTKNDLFTKLISNDIQECEILAQKHCRILKKHIEEVNKLSEFTMVCFFFNKSYLT